MAVCGASKTVIIKRAQDKKEEARSGMQLCVCLQSRGASVILRYCTLSFRLIFETLKDRWALHLVTPSFLLLEEWRGFSFHDVSPFDARGDTPLPLSAQDRDGLAKRLCKSSQSENPILSSHSYSGSLDRRGAGSRLLLLDFDIENEGCL